MLPAGCIGWEYKHHPGRSTILPARTQEVIEDIQAGKITLDSLLADTRNIHSRMFSELIPQGASDYYAGHYRGEHFRCLRPYPIQVPRFGGTPPRVGGIPPLIGTAPVLVYKEMGEFGKTAASKKKLLDAALSANPEPSALDKLLLTVKYAAWLFSRFLEIHPYANGNGHIARIILIASMLHYGYPLHGFTVDPGPGGLDYYLALQAYQTLPHDPVPLEKYILRFALPPTPPTVSVTNP